MDMKKILIATFGCLTLLLASFVRAEPLRVGASLSDEAGRTVASQRRGDKRKSKKKRTKKMREASVQEGVWGGPHVRMSVRDGGASLEFDCASGEIAEPLNTDAEGRFDVAGTFTRQSPGPIRIGREPSATPARYAGRIEGQTITLTIKLEGAEQNLESYKLTRGSEGRLWRCL